MRLSKLIQSIEVRKIAAKDGDFEREIDGLFIDGRKCCENGLFFCLSGGKNDSHAYARQAMKNGAVAIVVERELPLEILQIIVEDSRLALGVLASTFYGNPSQELKVIGVTGTNGKTTVSYMLESICREGGKITGVIGTLGIRYGEKRKENPLTTPDPIELQKTLAEMLLCGVEYVVMEVSAHALYYKKTAGVRFRACIFTNLSQDHLDFFSSMQAYRQAKLDLFSPDVCPLAIVNGDEDMGREIGRLREKAGCKTVLYGLNTPVDAFAIVTNESLRAVECMLNINDILCRVGLSLSGRHNVYNALAAAACAVELGFSPKTIAGGLTKLKGVEGRLQRVASFRGAEIYIDFAHTPDGLQKSLEALKGYCEGRLICLFGCGGNRDASKRPLMGEVAAKLCDFAVLTSDNPRYEDPLDIIAGIERGYRRFSSRYVIVSNREFAIDYALEFLRAKDILLIAGKGGEKYQEIMGIKYDFNDHATVSRILQKKEKNSL